MPGPPNNLLDPLPPQRPSARYEPRAPSPEPTLTLTHHRAPRTKGTQTVPWRRPSWASLARGWEGKLAGS